MVANLGSCSTSDTRGPSLSTILLFGAKEGPFVSSLAEFGTCYRLSMLN